MKKNGWLIAAAFLGGILLANLTEKELLTTYGILNTYFLNQYARQTINLDRLFCHVFLERMKAAFLLFVCGRVIDGGLFFVLVECLCSAAFGYLMVVAIVNLGVRGIAVILCGMFPQWLFYAGALYCFAMYRKEERYPVWQSGGVFKKFTVRTGVLVLPVLLLVLGIVAEGYVNPVFLGKMLKIL